MLLPEWAYIATITVLLILGGFFWFERYWSGYQKGWQENDDLFYAEWDRDNQS